MEQCAEEGDVEGKCCCCCCWVYRVMSALKLTQEQHPFYFSVKALVKMLRLVRASRGMGAAWNHAHRQ